MKRVILGKTCIETSYVGIGTSWAYQGVLCSAKLKIKEYPELLRFAYEKGITYWDTSLTYGTHSAIKDALKDVPRNNVVICSKSVDTNAKNMQLSIEKTLKEISTDYIDIFMLHAVRNKFDFWHRTGALEMLHSMKKKGYIRAVGAAIHGLGALEKCKTLDLDVIFGRINYSGHLMDSWQEDIKSTLAGMPAFKKTLQKLLPKSLFKKMASSVQANKASDDDRKTALRIFKELHDIEKCILGMKIFGEGNISHDVPAAISYVKNLPFITAIVLGCCSKQEISEVIRCVDITS